MHEIFSGKKYDVEHALNMYALSYVLLPASYIYNEEFTNVYREEISRCHIYLIGEIPTINTIDIQQNGDEIAMTMRVVGEDFIVRFPIPRGGKLIQRPDETWIVETVDGEHLAPEPSAVISELARIIRSDSKIGTNYDFEVLYIGQAFGENGSRSALDRLKSHSTLQRIAIEGAKPDHQIQLLMIQIEPANRIFTLFNPWASEKDNTNERTSNGTEKLFNTTEAEKTTLYEASLIRYFQPRYNKEFVNSFPSTNMKTLRDCYDKDISAIIAEIWIDDLPFRIFSSAVSPTDRHFILHNLHSEADRGFFFGLRSDGE